ncbi:DUF998 domain-containing protein [Micromonospora sp. NPDC047793]|uniref:DUF998 domain-containing protein n=1 Tax=unclassified Micromonospora TaxID=2617518 RepID=UPI001033FE33|nr:DUF998 domain-containing protein [Verrucosispora sp. SN26_14.1]TBL30114.1 DUF998 domain-containing protein [Verrucosispora sp. SN26_14.1]
MPATRNSATLALGGIVLAALLAVIGHAGVEDLDPLHLTVSDYAVSESGGAIHLAMLTLAAASAVLVLGLRRLDRPAGPAGTGRGGVGAAQVLLAAWAGGLLLAGLVPTNPPGTEMDTAAYLHRYASVVAFLALPLAGWLIAAQLPTTARTASTAGTASTARTARWLRALAVASLLLAAAMIWSAYPGDRAYYGLIERALILAEVVLLTVLAATLLPTPRPGPLPGDPGDPGDHGVMASTKAAEVHLSAGTTP